MKAQMGTDMAAKEFYGGLLAPELPEQIWHAVLGQLGYRDVVAVACTCPRLYLLAVSINTEDGEGPSMHARFFS